MSAKIDELKTAISSFVAQIESITTTIEDEVTLREQKAQGLLKQAAIIQESQNKLAEDRKILSAEQVAIDKEKEAARDRKLVLDQREKELQAKSEQIQRILNAV